MIGIASKPTDSHRARRKAVRPVPSAQNGRSAEAVYAALGQAVECDVRSKARDIRALLESRFGVGSGSAAVRLGLVLWSVHESLGIHRFQDWIAGEFFWTQPTVTKYMQSATVFEHVACLDNFVVTALYLLSCESVPEGARAEAIERAAT